MNMMPAVDSEGYLVDLDDWSIDTATRLAENEQRKLTAEHWSIINIARDFYARYEIVPAMRPLTKAVRQTLGDDASSLYLMRLFPEQPDRPESPARIVARLAGLPRPTNCH